MNEKQQSNEQQPRLGQRCHVDGKGFGTIVKIREEYGNKDSFGKLVLYVRVKLDAQESHWYKVEQLELLPPSPAG
jgi:hypothetical protein